MRHEKDGRSAGKDTSGAIRSSPHRETCRWKRVGYRFRSRGGLRTLEMLWFRAAPKCMLRVQVLLSTDSSSLLQPFDGIRIRKWIVRRQA